MKNATQLLHQFKDEKISNFAYEMLKDIEMNHLRLAYETGQRDKQTFEEWYEATFNK